MKSEITLHCFIMLNTFFFFFVCVFAQKKMVEVETGISCCCCSEKAKVLIHVFLFFKSVNKTS